MSLALDLACALDPVVFARQVGLEPDPWQAAMLGGESRELILLCSRQSGKSTITAALALHRARRAPLTVLLLAPSQRQSSELYKKITGFQAKLGDEVVESETVGELQLRNGSRIICLPGNASTVRGYSADLVIIDEAAHIEGDDLYQAVRPMLAVTGGRLILLSTPWGKRGFLHSVWVFGGLSWERIKVTAEECPRIDPQWLENERKQLSEWQYRQEYECSFEDAEGSVFKHETVLAAVDDDLDPWFDGEPTYALTAGGPSCSTS